MERKPARRVHPGRIIQRELNAIGENVHWLSRQCRLPLRDVANVISGVYDLTPVMVEGISQAFGTSEVLWFDLQQVYDQWTDTEEAL